MERFHRTALDEFLCLVFHKELYLTVKGLQKDLDDWIRDYSDYEEVLWFKNVPHEPECYSAAWGAKREQDDEGDRDIWLEVRKRKEPTCPKIPDECVNWVNPSTVSNSDEGHIPELYERITIPPTEKSRPEDEEISQEPIVLVNNTRSRTTC